MNRFQKVAAGLAEGIMTARYANKLSHMSDRQLAAIGLDARISPGARWSWRRAAK